MYLSGGFQDRLEVKVVSSDGKYEMRDDEKQMLSSTHEEADTRVFTQLLQSEMGVKE